VATSIFENLPVKIAYSTLKDGAMKYEMGEDEAKVVENRRHFLQTNGSSIENSTLLSVSYGEDIVQNRTLDVSKENFGKGMFGVADIEEADAIFTVLPEHTLFLPLADCGGVVLFDEKKGVLGLAHLGRHATLDDLAVESIRHMEKEYGTNPGDIYIWISPAISKDSYWLHTFDAAHQKAWKPRIKPYDSGFYVDLQGYNIDKFVESGVPKSQIERVNIDTAKDPSLPSHYAYKTLGKKEKAGRFAVMAYIEG
jgi:copper oxidase (laccase) domain-containing protein